jgi:hypothetical protein
MDQLRLIGILDHLRDGRKPLRGCKLKLSKSGQSGKGLAVDGLNNIK